MCAARRLKGRIEGAVIGRDQAKSCIAYADFDLNLNWFDLPAGTDRFVVDRAGWCARPAVTVRSPARRGDDGGEHERSSS
jgi:hypothetical protein